MSDNRSSQDIEQEALTWVTRLTSGQMTQSEAASLTQWRQQSSAHEQAFRDAARLWGAVGSAMEADGATSPARRQGPGLSRRLVLVGGAASASAAAAGLALGVFPSFQELLADYRTATGEQRHISLPDGTSVELNARSSIKLDFDASVRKVRLIEGDAVFTVKPDQARSFVVDASNGTVRARGTVFAVRHIDHDVTVTCLEGSVEVRCDKVVTLNAAQQVSYSHGKLGAIAVADPEMAVAWRRGLLVFRDELLGDVVGELNRYHPGRIVLARPGLNGQRVSGVFHLARTAEALDHIKGVLGLSTANVIGGVVLVF